MKKKFVFALIIVILLSLLVIGAASAKGKWVKGWLVPNGPSERLFKAWFHTSQKGNIVHARELCSPDWSECARTTTVYNTEKFAEAPMCEFNNGTVEPAILWEARFLAVDGDQNVYADYPSAWVCWDFSEPWPAP